MDPATIAGLSIAGGNLLGNVFGNSASKKQQKRSQEWELKMWNLNNEYNTPLAQRKRMEAGGFNPNLVYGNGSVMNTAQQPHAPNMPPIPTLDVGGAMAGYFDTKMKVAQTNNIEKTNEVLQAEIANKNANTAKTLEDTKLSQFQWSMNNTLKQNSIDAALAATKGQQLDNALKVQDMDLKSLEKINRTITNSNLNRTQKLQIENYVSDLLTKKNQRAVNTAQYNTNAIKTKTDMRKIGFDMDAKEIELELQRMGLKLQEARLVMEGLKSAAGVIRPKGRTNTNYRRRR